MRRSVRSLCFVTALTMCAVGFGLQPHAEQQRAPRPGFPGAPPRDLPPDAADSEGTATLRGRVTRADTGEPLRRTHVMTQGGRGMVRGGQMPKAWATTTDAQGYYELTDIPAGRYILSARKAGFVTLQHGQRRVDEPGTPIEVSADQALDEIDFRLPRGGVVTGHIFDEFGEPVAETTVSVLSQRYIQGRRELVPAGRSGGSDDRGQYRVYGLPPGQYWVSASVQDFRSSMAETSNTQGYAPTFYPGTANVAEAQMLSLSIGQELTSIDFVLGAGANGPHLRDGNRCTGTPIREGDGLRVSGVSGLAMMGSMSFGRVDSNGRFVMSNLSPGTYTLRLQGSGFGADDGGVATATVTVGNGDVEGIHLAATLGATARGVVVTEGGGQPGFAASQLQVRKQPTNTNQIMISPGAIGPSRVDDDWTFEVRGLFGDELISVSGLPAGWGLKAVRFRGSDITDRALTTEELNGSVELKVVITDRVTRLSGTVTDTGGAPALEYTVVVFPEDRDRRPHPTRFVSTARPDQDGLFKIDGLPPGRYYAVAANYVPQQAWTSPEYLEQLSPWTPHLS